MCFQSDADLGYSSSSGLRCSYRLATCAQRKVQLRDYATRALFYLVCISVNSVRRHPVEHILYPGRIGKQLNEGLQFSGNVPSARDNGGNDAIILTQPALVRLVPSRNHAGDRCSIFRAHACTCLFISHLSPRKVEKSGVLAFGVWVCVHIFPCRYTSSVEKSSSARALY